MPSVLSKRSPPGALALSYTTTVFVWPTVTDFVSDAVRCVTHLTVAMLTLIDEQQSAARCGTVALQILRSSMM
jgi:hypothetical protein